MKFAVGQPPNTGGTHFVVEYSVCERGILDDEAAIESLLIKAAESIGTTIVARVFHRFRPGGVTGCVMLPESHLTIHTWPEAGYTSFDIYACNDLDPHRAHTILAEGLQAQDSQILVVERGLPIPEMIRVKDHRRVASFVLDCRGNKLPNSVFVGRSPGRGFGLFVSRDFSLGELIYESPATMAEWDAEFIVETDLGRSIHSGDSFGYELHPPLIETWSEQVRKTLMQHYNLQDPTPAMLLRSITDDGRRQVLILAFHGLKSHSDDPNTILNWSDATIKFGEKDDPVWTVPARAIRPIRAGEEMFVDYRVSLFDFVPPEGWIP